MTFLLILSLIVVLWVNVVEPILEADVYFNGLYPMLQYIIWNIGTEASIMIPFGALFSLAFRKELNIKSVLSTGFASFLIFSLTIDNALFGPFYLSPDGLVLIPISGGALEGTAVDCAFAELWKTLFGVSGFAWYEWTYVGTALLGIGLSALLFAPSIMTLFGSEYGMTKRCKI